MEGRVSRGGSWKRGGRGGNDSESSGGEHRGRGRGGQHRGRGKRDHHRGRGRGGAGRAADFRQRDRDEDDTFEEEDGRAEVFSRRRKLESNWDRYEESEKAAEDDDDAPTLRGTDFNALLESAGDSFSQFRFAEEKEWEMDPFIESLMSLVSLDLNALAQTLQQLPLHQRLDLEPELVEVSTPAELPAMRLAPKPDVPQTSRFVPPSAAFQGFSLDQRVPGAAAGPVLPGPGPGPGPGSAPAAEREREEEEEEDADEELEQLLSFQKRVAGAAGASVQEVAAPQKPREDVKEKKEKEEEEEEEVKAEDAATPEAAKQEVTQEEDLEDWLDSMIS